MMVWVMVCGVWVMVYSGVHQGAAVMPLAVDHINVKLVQNKLKEKEKKNNEPLNTITHLSDFDSTIRCDMFVKVKDWSKTGSRHW